MGNLPNKIKILFIHHAKGWGGAAINMVNIINCLDKTVFDVKVLLIKNSIVAEKLMEHGINFEIARSAFYKHYYHYFTHSEAEYIKWYQVFKFIKVSILWLLSRFFFAKRELAMHAYDIVHLNSSVLTDWLAPAKRRSKVIIHIQEPFRKGKFDVLRPVFRRQMRKYADCIIAISQDNARRVNLPEKTMVVFNYAEISGKEPPDNSYSSRKVLYLGGSDSIKGYYTLMDALDYLDKNIMVYFGGYYPSQDKQISLKGFLKQLAKQLLRKKQNAAIRKMHNHPNAIVIGLTHKVNYYLNEVCCLVSPFSVPHFARPIIEAFLQKKPVIGSDVEGMDEIIEYGVTGLIVPKNDPKALAKAINELACNSQLAKQLGETGYSFAINKFTFKNIKHFENIYNQLASREK